MAKKLGMTQENVAYLLGIAPRILMTLIDQRKITPDDIRKTGQSHSCSSQWERDEFYRRFGSPAPLLTGGFDERRLEKVSRPPIGRAPKTDLSLLRHSVQ
jgi:hypothetical protein